MCLQALVQQSPHLLSQGCNLVANWLEDGGKNWKLKLEMVIVNIGGGARTRERSGDMTGASSLHRSDQWSVRGLIWSTKYTRIFAHRHARARGHTQASPAGAITSSGRRDYLALLSCRAILGCSWKFTLCPCVRVFFFSSLSPFSLSSFLPSLLLSCHFPWQANISGSRYRGLQIK